MTTTTKPNNNLYVSYMYVGAFRTYHFTRFTRLKQNALLRLADGRERKRAQSQRASERASERTASVVRAQRACILLAIVIRVPQIAQRTHPKNNANRERVHIARNSSRMCNLKTLDARSNRRHHTGSIVLDCWVVSECTHTPKTIITHASD